MSLPLASASIGTVAFLQQIGTRDSWSSNSSRSYWKLTVDIKWVWVYNTFMNSKLSLKRSSHRNQVLYYIQDNVTFDYYIGLTALSFKGNVFKTLRRSYAETYATCID
jgi:hypothetical protein